MQKDNEKNEKYKDYIIKDGTLKSALILAEIDSAPYADYLELDKLRGNRYDQYTRKVSPHA